MKTVKMGDIAAFVIKKIEPIYRSPIKYFDSGVFKSKATGVEYEVAMRLTEVKEKVKKEA